MNIEPDMILYNKFIKQFIKVIKKGPPFNTTFIYGIRLDSNTEWVSYHYNIEHGHTCERNDFCYKNNICECIISQIVANRLKH